MNENLFFPIGSMLLADRSTGRYILDRKSFKEFHFAGMFLFFGWIDAGLEHVISYPDREQRLAVLFSAENCRIIHVYEGWLKKDMQFKMIGWMNGS